MTSHSGFAQQPAERSASASGYVGFAFVAALAAVGCYLAVTVYQNEGAERAAGSITPDQIKTQFTGMTGAERTAKLDELRARLAAEPLDRRVLSEISLLLALEGDSKSAEQLTLVAADRSLRDPAALGQALNILLQRGDAEKSLALMDGLIRARPKLADTLFDQMLAIAAASREGEAQVAKLMASNPPWRMGLVTKAASKADNATGIYRLLQALKDTPSPAADNEVRLLLAALVKAKNFAQAYYVWLDMLNAEALTFAGNVYDSGFEAQPRSLFFDWSIVRTRTVEVKTTQRATGSADSVLRVDYVGNRTNVASALQYVRLAPGNYIFSGDQKSEGLKTEGGINWQLSCVEGGGGVLARSPKLSDTSQWTRFDVKLTVPANCTTQLLALVAVSTAKLDQQVSGSALFDNISITAISAAAVEE